MEDYSKFGFNLYHTIRLAKRKNGEYIFIDDKEAFELIQKIIILIKDNYSEHEEYNKALEGFINNLFVSYK